MEFELATLGLTYTVVTNIALLGLTVSDLVVLSAAVTASFHYCGSEPNWISSTRCLLVGLLGRQYGSKQTDSCNLDAIKHG